MQLLIVRFSSFGDIFQALEIVPHIQRVAPDSTIDWLVRKDFAPLLEGQRGIRTVYEFDRKSSVFELIRVAWSLAPHYTHLYDAHSNLRSGVVRGVFRLRWLLMGRFSPSRVLIRSKERVRRFLYFRCRIVGLRFKVLPEPYRGAESYVQPLKTWFPQLRFDFKNSTWAPCSKSPSSVQAEFASWKSRSKGPVIAFAPSAAWPNKRWPIERWSSLAKLILSSDRETRFLLLGGPEDVFLQDLVKDLGADVCFSAVGRSTLLESASLLAEIDALVANDTGLLHVADRLQKPLVGIIGPTAFGYPSGAHSLVAEVSNADLRCKPCSKDGRDRCTNSVELKCLKLIEPEDVLKRLLEARSIKGTSIGTVPAEVHK